MNPYWSYLLTAVGVFGLWLAGRKDRRGWMVGIGAQVLWIAYATATQQWGFYVSALAYGWVYIKNARAWKKAEDSVTHLNLEKFEAYVAKNSPTPPRGTEQIAAFVKATKEQNQQPQIVKKPLIVIDDDRLDAFKMSLQVMNQRRRTELMAKELLLRQLTEDIQVGKITVNQARRALGYAELEATNES